MKKIKLMDEAKLIEKAVEILMRELGPIESYRFLSLRRGKRMESLKRHRAWQRKLDAKEFFDQVFRAS